MTHEIQKTSASKKDPGSYPVWAQDMMADCAAAENAVLNHPMWELMRTATIQPITARNFMVGLWSTIERFPDFMAFNLVKTKYGRSVGDNMARRWLVRNIRVEQNHAEYWLDWAEGSGVSRQDVLTGEAPAGSDILLNWCEEISRNGSLAAGMIATNYAIEGVTGKWASIVNSSDLYKNSVPMQGRKSTLRWLELHADYDDEHPWEALEIVCALVGNNPKLHEVDYLKECIRRSYTAMKILGDRCLDNGHHLWAQSAAA
jgi:pyrroloquinoline quinone (PQQ) biosynthesis protein C